MKKTTDEQIDDVRNRIGKLQSKLKDLLQKKTEDERIAKDNRLMEHGGLLEEFIDGVQMLTYEQIKLFLKKTVQSSFALKALEEVRAQTKISSKVDGKTTDKAEDAQEHINAATSVTRT